MSTTNATTPGYVTDVGYSATFTPALAPEWLDLVALISGYAPPARDDGFAYCELACGRALTSAVLAATHPNATFHAVDFMQEHIAYAESLVERAGIGNLTLHATDFAGAARMELPRFQYIVAHGAYSWIDAQARRDLLGFIDRHLAEDGLVYLSYNAMPGWLADLPLQRLIAALAQGAAGDSLAKFSAAETELRRLSAAGVPALMMSPMFARFLATQRDQLPANYFAHEYLAPAWQPLYVTDVRGELASIGLRPSGSAILADNFDSFVLRTAQRDALAGIDDDNVRELVRDCMLMTDFRCDVFHRNATRLNESARRREMLRRRFALVRPEPLVTWSMRTKAGTLRFDNPMSRAIVAALEQGPLPLRRIEGPANDVVANALSLASAGIIRPVNQSDTPVAALNQVLVELDSEAVPLPYRALPCGTALRLEPMLHGYLRGRGRLPRRLRAWPDFLAGAIGANRRGQPRAGNQVATK
jgi:Predicted methyltransferase regulatory domain/Methyltransferase domain